MRSAPDLDRAAGLSAINNGFGFKSVWVAVMVTRSERSVNGEILMDHPYVMH